MLRAIIADDEELGVQMLKVLLHEAQDSVGLIEIVKTCGTGDETLKAIDELSPDVVFLDIHMPAGNGMVVAEALLKDKANPPHIIFITAHAEHAVRAAEEAVYPQDALSKIPPRLYANWTNPAPGGPNDRRTIAREVKRLVRFRQLNLLRPWPFNALFDVIFCRNVMIYFDGPTKEQLVHGFARQLRPGGYLYIGHSERVSGPASDLLEPVGTTIYRKIPA